MVDFRPEEAPAGPIGIKIRGCVRGLSPRARLGRLARGLGMKSDLIVVAGAGGFIGGHLIADLRRRQIARNATHAQAIGAIRRDRHIELAASGVVGYVAPGGEVFSARPAMKTVVKELKQRE